MGLRCQLATIAFSLGFATAVEVAVDPSGAQQQLNEELLAMLRAGMQSEMHELRKGQGSLLQQQQQILELLRTTTQTQTQTQTPPPPPPTTPTQATLPWLLLGIPTVPRPSGANYLPETLSHVLDAVPDDPADPMFGQVRAMVVNQRPGAHPVFEQLRRQHSASATLLFLERPAEAAAAEAAEAAAAAATAARRPPLSDAEQERQRRVRQHTRDVVAMVRLVHCCVGNAALRPRAALPSGPSVRRRPNLRAALGLAARWEGLQAETFGRPPGPLLLTQAHRRSRLFLFLEDDWRLCPLSLLALQHVASKASRYDPAWLSVRVSFGLAGVVRLRRRRQPLRHPCSPRSPRRRRGSLPVRRMRAGPHGQAGCRRSGDSRVRAARRDSSCTMTTSTCPRLPTTWRPTSSATRPTTSRRSSCSGCGPRHGSNPGRADPRPTRHAAPTRGPRVALRRRRPRPSTCPRRCCP